VNTAIVTGAASGIGFATATRLAKDGWPLALVDVDEKRLDEKAKILGDGGAKVETHVLDLLAADRFGQVVERVGACDLLVNDAGVGVAATLLETSAEDWDRIIAINLTAMFHTCRAVLPGMLGRGHGLIVNVSSIAGVVGLKNRLGYCAAKHGLIGLTRALAVEYTADRLRVNAVCPGGMLTPQIENFSAPQDANFDLILRTASPRRMMAPLDVANVIAFLASEDAAYVNGQVINVDGGMVRFLRVACCVLRLAVT